LGLSPGNGEAVPRYLTQACRNHIDRPRNSSDSIHRIA
jgi:hypothetical protein